MFETSRPQSNLGLVLNFFEVTFHASVRKVRQNHNNAIVAIALSIVQSLLFVAAFYFMFTLLGGRTMAIRGNYLLYLMSGIFIYLSHIQTVRGVMGAEGPTSDMMQHAPMNTLVGIVSAALSILYTKFIALLCVLLMIHVLIEPIEIHYWPGAFGMFLLSWFVGVAIGVIFMSLAIWFPDVVSILSMVYIRANMIFSGKMFVANMLPAMMLPVFSWNPLFHIIDQTRGHVFVNYIPHNTSPTYPLYMAMLLFLIGMMLEHYTRQHASVSWGAKR